MTRPKRLLLHAQINQIAINTYYLIWRLMVRVTSSYRLLLHDQIAMITNLIFSTRHSSRIMSVPDRSRLFRCGQIVRRRRIGETGVAGGWVKVTTCVHHG